jgi:hypothetical protein
MKVNFKDLLEDWIIYLKNNGLAKKKSNADGSLDYLRGPDSSDIQQFLIKQGFDRNQIRKALNSVGEPSGELPSTPTPSSQKGPEDKDEEQSGTTTSIQPVDQEPTKIKKGKEVEFPGVNDAKFVFLGNQWARINPKTGKPAKYAPKDVSIVLNKLATGQEPETRELLSARRRLGLLSSKEYIGHALLEALSLKSFSEEQIEQIFKIITSPEKEEPKDAKKELELVPKDHELGLVPKEEDTPEYKEKMQKEQERKTSELNAIKKSIRDNFTDRQRKALWRILTNV